MSSHTRLQNPFFLKRVFRSRVIRPPFHERGAPQNTANSKKNPYQRTVVVDTLQRVLRTGRAVHTRMLRKVFLIDGLESRFRELVTQICDKNDIDILALDCSNDYVHLHVNVPPSLSPSDVMKVIRGNTGTVLKEEFLKHDTSRIWTRNYLVSTDIELEDKVIIQYIELQKRNLKSEDKLC